jgi:endoglucanase
MLETIQKLTALCAPSGGEAPLADFILQQITPFADEVRRDALGNIIARKKSPRAADKKLLVAAHMDEIGVMATFIEENGFVRFGAVGGVSAKELLYQRVTFQNGTAGVIGLDDSREGAAKEPRVTDLYLDIGAPDGAAAARLVKIGDLAAFAPNFAVSGAAIFSKALDDRLGCAILIEALKKIKTPKFDLYFAFTAQEELGLRGAKTAAFGVDPDLALAIDVTDTGDAPGRLKMATALGKGPCIKLRDSSLICHPTVRDLLADAAEREKIPYQFEVLARGGTDGGAIALSRGGVPTGGLSVVARGIHTANESASLSDVQNAAKLLCCAVAEA